MLLHWLRKLFALFAPASPPRKRTVGAALDVRADEDTLPLLAAVVAVDRVHADGDLPVIPVERAALKKRHGQFTYRRAGPALGITIHPGTDHPALTTLHEIGHFLDYQALGVPHQWASLTAPALGAWREAVKGTEAVRRLGRMLAAPDGKFGETVPSGTVVEYPINVSYVRYLLRPEELWARSYAQFIAARSGDAGLLAELGRRREPHAGRLSYGEQWEDADFAPVATQMEALFRQRGWMD